MTESELGYVSAGRCGPPLSDLDGPLTEGNEEKTPQRSPDIRRTNATRLTGDRRGGPC